MYRISIFLNLKVFEKILEPVKNLSLNYVKNMFTAVLKMREKKNGGGGEGGQPRERQMQLKKRSRKACFPEYQNTCFV